MGLIRYVYRDLAPVISYPPHDHGEVWEMLLYTAGSGCSWCDDQSFPFQAGTIVGIPPGCRHFEQVDEPFTTIHWHIRDWDRPSDPIHLQDSHGTMGYVAELLHAEFSNRSDRWQESLHRLFQLMEVQLQRLESVAKRHSAIETLRWLFVNNFHDANFSLDVAMQKTGLKPSHLRRLWKAEFGETPVRSLTRRRLSEAKHLLHEYDLPVHRIAERVGFSDPLYFSRVFRQFEGCSPRMYRRQRQQADKERL